MENINFILWLEEAIVRADEERKLWEKDNTPEWDDYRRGMLFAYRHTLATFRRMVSE